MIEKIEFSGTNFYLTHLPVCISGLRKIEIPRDLKKSLRYQRLFLTDYDKKTWTVYDISGLHEVPISPDYQDAYVLVRRKEKFIDTEKLDSESEWLVKVLVAYFSGSKPEITEKLCCVLGDNFVRLYHKTYGRDNLAKFRDIIFSEPLNPGLRLEKLNYDRPRYSILSLARDLEMTSDLEIYTDPELIGKYKRITRKTLDGSRTLLDRWAKLVDITGNRTRANLSARVRSKVSVTIPENKVGIEPGEMEVEALRSFAFVCDGILNMTELGIRTKDTKLIGKLKRLGILESMLLDGEYVIDLEKLQMYSKSRPLCSYQLGLAEYRVRESDILESYLSRLIWKLKTGTKIMPTRPIKEEPVKTDKELFLESLGIYDGIYYPERTMSGIPEDSYYTTEVIGRVTGFPSDPSVALRDYINTGTTKYEALNDILVKYSSLRGEKDIKVLERKLEEIREEKKLRVSNLRSLKFKLILDKTFRFSDHHQPRVETKVVEVGKARVSWVVKDSIIQV